MGKILPPAVFTIRVLEPERVKVEVQGRTGPAYSPLKYRYVAATLELPNADGQYNRERVALPVDMAKRLAWELTSAVDEIEAAERNRNGSGYSDVDTHSQR